MDLTDELAAADAQRAEAMTLLGPILDERDLRPTWDALREWKRRDYLSYVVGASPAWKTARCWEIVNRVAEGREPPSRHERRRAAWEEIPPGALNPAGTPTPS